MQMYKLFPSIRLTRKGKINSIHIKLFQSSIDSEVCTGNLLKKRRFQLRKKGKNFNLHEPFL